MCYEANLLPSGRLDDEFDGRRHIIQAKFARVEVPESVIQVRVELLMQTAIFVTTLIDGPNIEAGLERLVGRRIFLVGEPTVRAFHQPVHKQD